MRKSSSIAALVLALSLCLPSVSHADFRRICRGASIPKYKIEMKRAVKAALDAANVSYSSVVVKFSRLKRDVDTFSPDFQSGLLLSGGSTPSVSFGGSFPEVTDCNVTGRMSILVNYPGNARTLTNKEVSIPGTMLWKVGPKLLASDTTGVD